jgi:hypothetical protein
MDRCCWDESARPRYGLGGFRQQADTGRALRANGRSIRRARTRLLPRPDHHPLDRSLPCQLVACVHNSTCSGHRVHDARRSEKVWSVYVPSTYGPCARSNGTPGRALSLATPMHAFSHTQRPPPLNLFDQCKDRTHYYPANAIDP